MSTEDIIWAEETYYGRQEEQENITISRGDLNELLKDSLMLQCLREKGVEDWCGYDDALEMFVKVDAL